MLVNTYRGMDKLGSNPHQSSMEEEESDTGEKKQLITLLWLLLCSPRNTAALTLHSTVLIYLMISEYLNDTMCSLSRSAYPFMLRCPVPFFLAQSCACARRPFYTHTHTRAEH